MIRWCWLCWRPPQCYRSGRSTQKAWQQSPRQWLARRNDTGDRFQGWSPCDGGGDGDGDDGDDGDGDGDGNDGEWVIISAINDQLYETLGNTNPVPSVCSWTLEIAFSRGSLQRSCLRGGIGGVASKIFEQMTKIFVGPYLTSWRWVLSSWSCNNRTPGEHRC